MIRPAHEMAAEIAAADHVDVAEVLGVGVAVLAGLDTYQRSALVGVLRQPDHMRDAALASVGRTIIKARQDLARHREMSSRWDRRRRREQEGLDQWS